MTFADSLVAWIILILFITAIIFIIFAVILNWLRPREQRVELDNRREDTQQNNIQQGNIQENEVEQTSNKRRLIFLFGIIMTVIIMVCGGVNVLMDAKIK
ncbi:Hypothetical protein HVR_LOCUS1144 [uncultured virus]|nr:Hypothetical protein HVR_LOCUS1144 [uncultured virus]